MGPHVEEEQLQGRTVRHAAVDAAAVAGCLTDGHELLEGLLCTGGQDVDIGHRVPGVVEDLARVPVVGRLVVVPLGEDGDLGVEAPDVVVEQVVLVVAAELGQRLRHLGLLLRGDVATHPAVGQGDLGLDGAVGVDGVTAVDEEVGLETAHGLVDRHAAHVGVDAPALAGGVARPHQADVAGAGGRGAEVADDRLALDASVVQVLEADAVEDVLAGRQAVEVDLGSEVARLVGNGTQETARSAERLGGSDLDHHATGSIGAGPHHRAGGGHVAALHTVGDHRPVGTHAEQPAGLGHDHRGVGDHAGGDGTAAELEASGQEAPTAERATAGSTVPNHGPHSQPPVTGRDRYVGGAA